MRRALRSPTVVVLLPVLAACSGGGAPGGGEEVSGAADSVALAAELYDPATFDTIEWVADSAALNRGAVVWTYSCQKCHGPTGQGDGGFVMDGDTLRPPSFQAEDWEFASDADALRRQIFQGTTEGMPHWGLVGLKARDIDAVTRYIQEVLRAPVRQSLVF